MRFKRRRAEVDSRYSLSSEHLACLWDHPNCRYTNELGIASLTACLTRCCPNFSNQARQVVGKRETVCRCRTAANSSSPCSQSQRRRASEKESCPTCASGPHTTS